MSRSVVARRSSERSRLACVQPAAFPACYIHRPSSTGSSVHPLSLLGHTYTAHHEQRTAQKIALHLVTAPRLQASGPGRQLLPARRRPPCVASHAAARRRGRAAVAIVSAPQSPCGDGACTRRTEGRGAPWRQRGCRRAWGRPVHRMAIERHRHAHDALMACSAQHRANMKRRYFDTLGTPSALIPAE